VLSGGEKSRLALVKLLLDPPNLLLMDEPTTHLDINSVDALLGALEEFTGTVVFISHDVYFIKELANHVVHVQEGRLTPYPGGYDYYLQKSAATSGRAGLVASAPGTAPRPSGTQRPAAAPADGLSRKEQKRREAEQRQARSRERRTHQERVSALETEIAELEGRQTELTAELEKPETYQQPGRPVEINRELTGVTTRLEQATAEWEAAAQRLAEFDLASSES